MQGKSAVLPYAFIIKSAFRSSSARTLIGYYLKGKIIYSGDVRQVLLTFNETYLPAFRHSVNGNECFF